MTALEEFRHLDYGPQATVADVGRAGLQALLDGGDVAGWRPVLAAIERDPWGAVASRVDDLLGHLESYGTSRALASWLRRCRAGVTAEPRSLAEVREAGGFTQRELAERMGVSQAQVARIETSRNPTLRSLRRYLGALDQHLQVLVATGTEGPTIIRFDLG